MSSLYSHSCHEKLINIWLGIASILKWKKHSRKPITLKKRKKVFFIIQDGERERVSVKSPSRFIILSPSQKNIFWKKVYYFFFLIACDLISCGKQQNHLNISQSFFCHCLSYEKTTFKKPGICNVYMTSCKGKLTKLAPTLVQVGNVILHDQHWYSFYFTFYFILFNISSLL